MAITTRGPVPLTLGCSIPLSALLASASLLAAELAPSDHPPTQDSTPVLTIEHAEQQRQLSLAEIESLPLYAVEMAHPEGLEGEFLGVLLDDFLVEHGLDDSERLRFIARDDYTTFLSPAEREEKTYLLVTRFEGIPLPDHHNGPLMLTVPADIEAVLDGSEPMTRWIWAITTLRAR
ncbi:hypothetical protein IEI94_09635 [Halomonas sp. ML-15]|uniref:hypothetical protein n=1 Tax=Halomonas sp. ML-15 TaxID=2773305 RepID=UPI0017478BC7|nr:hypothetical protein [Halomonas sp. ML-15]MBD3896111.1 hypothetical protein [Halomonas sp. ML-15]